MQKNIDFLAFRSNRDSLWKFTIVGKARVLSEVFDETLTITEKIFDLTRGFFIPTLVNSYMSLEQGEMPANYFFPMASSR